MSKELLPEDQRLYSQRAKLPDRVWVGKDAIGGLMIYPRLPDHRQASEYMRVMTRQEVEEFAESLEGVDPMQLINSLNRTIEGQRKHIARLQEQLRAAEQELGMQAEEQEPDSFQTLGIRESDFLP